jgi:hypothetical protein
VLVGTQAAMLVLMVVVGMGRSQWQQGKGQGD